MAEAPFLQRSRRAALAFLQSAVVIDDLAFQGSQPAPQTVPEVVVVPPEAEPLVEDMHPQEPIAAAEDDVGTAATGEPETTPPAGSLAVDEVQGGFVQLGMVCGVLRPTTSEEVEERYLPVASRADLVVLDWHLNKDNGVAATNLIRRLLSSDGGDRRTRLVAIYTNEPELKSIREIASQRLTDAGLEPQDRGEFALGVDCLHVVFLAKPEALTSFKEQIIEPRDLAAQLVNEFLLVASGLLSNLALVAIASIRENSDRLLTRFHERLDAAYLGQRAVSVSPGAAVDLALEIVLDEISEVVDEVELAGMVDMEAIREWLEHKVSMGLTFPTYPASGAPKQYELAWLLDRLDSGRGSSSQEISKSRPTGMSDKDWKLTRSLTNVFAPHADHDSLDGEFAKLTFLARSHTEPHAIGRRRPPRLVLGSLVCEERAPAGEPHHLLCVQPRCDSVRIFGERRFLFVPLVLPTEGDDQFDLVLEAEDGKLAKIKVRLTPFEFRIHTFTANPDERVVRASAVGEAPDAKWIFEAVGGRQFRWLGDLKSQHAQRITSSLAEKLDRVGMHESEWARLSGRWE